MGRGPAQGVKDGERMSGGIVYNHPALMISDAEDTYRHSGRRAVWQPVIPKLSIRMRPRNKSRGVELGSCLMTRRTSGSRPCAKFKRPMPMPGSGHPASFRYRPGRVDFCRSAVRCRDGEPDIQPMAGSDTSVTLGESGFGRRPSSAEGVGACLDRSERRLGAIVQCGRGKAEVGAQLA